MTWFKVDDRFHAHPKVLALRAGPCEYAAVTLWLKAGSWCAANLTDGVVPSVVVDSMIPKGGARAADELLRVGLWETDPAGYRFRSWDEYQPSKTAVEGKRQKTAEKVASWRERNRGRNQVTPENVTDGVTRLVTLPPTRPDPISPNGESSARPSPPPSPAIGTEAMLRSFSAHPDRDKRVTEAVSRARVAAGGAPFRTTGHTDRDAVARLGEWAESMPGGFADLDRALSGFFAAKGPSSRLSWLSEEDPGRYLGKTENANTSHADALRAKQYEKLDKEWKERQDRLQFERKTDESIEISHKRTELRRRYHAGEPLTW